MKLKFVLVPLVVLGFAVVSYADCTKDEIIKLIDKGYSKTEIDGLCGKSEKKSEVEEKIELEWVTPSGSVCKNNGGKIEDGVCKAKWSEAEDICSASVGRLASIDELKRVVTDCGGNLNASMFSVFDGEDSNKDNSSYQSCYKRKGFTSDFYWSSTNVNAIDFDVGNSFVNIYKQGSSVYEGITFNFGKVFVQDEDANVSVRCVRVG